jgi:hypothetical protein
MKDSSRSTRLQALPEKRVDLSRARPTGLGFLWPGAWAEFPDHQPPGDAYDLLDYGLVTPPALSAGR